MTKEKKQPKGWLAQQIKAAQKDMAKWPNWMKKAARWEGNK